MVGRLVAPVLAVGTVTCVGFVTGGVERHEVDVLFAKSIKEHIIKE